MNEWIWIQIQNMGWISVTQNAAQSSSTMLRSFDFIIVKTIQKFKEMHILWLDYNDDMAACGLKEIGYHTKEKEKEQKNWNMLHQKAATAIETCLKTHSQWRYDAFEYTIRIMKSVSK